MKNYQVILEAGQMQLVYPELLHLQWKKAFANTERALPAGLILCGGNSSRMGTNKGLIEYKGKPQFMWISDTLQALGIESSISCKPEQVSLFGSNRNIIPDKADDDKHGPLAGLLAAAEHYENKALFLVACDYPLLEPYHLYMLTEAYKGSGKTVCLFDFREQMPQPLICIYSPEALQQIKESALQGNSSLLHVLKQTDYMGLVPEHPLVMMSFDTPRDREDFNSLKASMSV